MSENGCTNLALHSFCCNYCHAGPGVAIGDYSPTAHCMSYLIVERENKCIGFAKPFPCGYTNFPPPELRRKLDIVSEIRIIPSLAANCGEGRQAPNTI